MRFTLVCERRLSGCQRAVYGTLGLRNFRLPRLCRRPLAHSARKTGAAGAGIVKVSIPAPESVAYRVGP